ncbi:hypothetical protein [Duganella sp. Leaf126]|uniref:hypothetical protein n=1 Tax=Duganella sp. Leaf126 TaxID=1736266 RepID=UPI0012E2785D|nr:hypothetical protein [Duganella sp. Leaf126]
MTAVKWRGWDARGGFASSGPSASFLSNACYDGPTSSTAQRPVPNNIMASNPQRQGSRGPEAFQALAERRLVKHEPVAKALRSAAPSIVDEIISLAYIQVAKWEQDSLCSKDYIAAWRELLKSPAAAAAVLEERSSRAAALRQNSPFVATIRKFQSLAHAA